jgi:hypothetical protein
MILRNGKFSGKILRKIFRAGKFSMENFPPHITIRNLGASHEVCWKGWQGGREDTDWLTPSLFLSSFCGPHTGFSHQGQLPKTVEATVVLTDSIVWKYVRVGLLPQYQRLQHRRWRIFVLECWYPPTSPLHACPLHGSWATFIRLSHARAKSEILTL